MTTKGLPAWNKGIVGVYKASAETKKKMSDSLKGRKLSEENKRKIGLSNKGKIRTEECKKKWSDQRKGRVLTKETREKMSKSKVGIMPINLLRTGKWGNIHRGYYDINGKSMFFRSMWEVNYALYLDFLIKQKQIKSWEYEVDTFWFENIKRGVRSYLPDFKVFNKDGTFEYHEVKGYMDPKSATKLKRMAKYHPKIKMVLIGKTEYKELKQKVGRMAGSYE